MLGSQEIGNKRPFFLQWLFIRGGRNRWEQYGITFWIIYPYLVLMFFINRHFSYKTKPLQTTVIISKVRLLLPQLHCEH